MFWTSDRGNGEDGKEELSRVILLYGYSAMTISQDSISVQPKHHANEMI